MWSDNETTNDLLGFALGSFIMRTNVGTAYQCIRSGKRRRFQEKHFPSRSQRGVSHMLANRPAFLVSSRQA